MDLVQDVVDEHENGEIEAAVHPEDYEQCLALQDDDPPSHNPTSIQRFSCIVEIELLQMKVCSELTELCDRIGMPVTQENGQRKLGPPNDHTGPPPPKGCEIFVGKIPRDIYEPELVPIFQRAGKIFEIRLMMDFSGTNRGYCFVHYYTQEEANRAVRELNDYEIRKGRYIGVVKSVDNCRLFIGGLPKDKNEDDILKEIDRITEGVVRVIAYPSPADKTKNRGFAFVEYESHKSAAMARRKMIPGKIPMWDVDVAVDWAEPEPNVDPEIMNKVQNLYVRNLMLETTEDTLRARFNEHSRNGVDKVKKIKDYAFIHFVTREQAEEAKSALESSIIDGAQIEITWAKPVNKAVYKAQKALSKELYPTVGVRNSRGRGGMRNAQNYTGNAPRPFGPHQPANYQGTGLLPLPAYLQGGGGFLTPGMVQALHPGVGMGGQRPLVPTRHRAAAGVQGIRMPAQTQHHAYVHHHEPPSRQVMQYINSMAPTAVPADQYLSVYSYMHAAPPPMYPVLRVKQHVQELFETCVRYGWGEPAFTTELHRVDNMNYYRSSCNIQHHPSGPKTVRCQDMFTNEDDARAGAAEVMTRFVNAETSNTASYPNYQQPPHQITYSYPAVCPAPPAPAAN